MNSGPLSPEVGFLAALFCDSASSINCGEPMQSSFQLEKSAFKAENLVIALSHGCECKVEAAGMEAGLPFHQALSGSYSSVTCYSCLDGLQKSEPTGANLTPDIFPPV